LVTRFVEMVLLILKLSVVFVVFLRRSKVK
jgi:hypothetical protein